MRHTLLALLVLSPSALAQTVATATPRVGCTVPAPPSSLVAEPHSPRVHRPDANGVVVLELETAGAVGAWSLETTLPGYGGEGYLRWSGPDLPVTSGVDTLSFTFEVPQDGTYAFRLWSQQNAQNAGQENDCWVRLDGAGWLKVHGWQVGFWNQTAIVHGTGDILRATLTAGLHTIDFSGRSTNFKIDRLEIVPDAMGWGDMSRPASDVMRSRPVLGTEFRMQLGDPHDVAGFGANALTILVLSRPNQGGPCGAVLPSFGELMVQMPLLMSPIVTPWAGSGTTNSLGFPVPNDASLLGRTFTWQGALVEPHHFVLTDALDVHLGDA